MSVLHYYVYYKFDPARIEEVRAVVDRLFKQVREATGVQGQWQRRRDDPSTFMEIYVDVPDAKSFDAALQAAVDPAGFASLGVSRITEVFKCA